jgi:prophage regulatory protein
MKKTSETFDHSTNPHRIVREPERLALTGVSRSQWWRLEGVAEAPRRVKLSTAADGISHGWPYGELIQWIEARKAARSGTKSR